MSFDIRPWRPGDEPKILELFQLVFGRPMSMEFWQWRFDAHPAGAPLVMLAWDGDTLAGHYAASHAPLLIDGERVPAALSMATMTHPGYRGRNLLALLGNALYETLASDGHVMAWGFPNGNAHVPRRLKLDWIDVWDVATMTAENFSPSPSEVTVEDAPAIDDRFSRLEHRITDRSYIQSYRDLSILKWRIDANPVNEYIRLVIPDGDEIAGYAILKRWGAEAIDLIELRATDQPSVRAMLAAVLDRAAAEGAKRVHAWRLPSDPDRITFERAGFAAGAPITYFGGRVLNPAAGPLDDPRRWRLSMIDSDLY